MNLQVTKKILGPGKNISYITSIPLVLIVIFAISILKISGRENIDEFNNSLTNIQNIENLK